MNYKPNKLSLCFLHQFRNLQSFILDLQSCLLCRNRLFFVYIVCSSCSVFRHWIVRALFPVFCAHHLLPIRLRPPVPPIEMIIALDHCDLDESHRIRDEIECKTRVCVCSKWQFFLRFSHDFGSPFSKMFRLRSAVYHFYFSLSQKSRSSACPLKKMHLLHVVRSTVSYDSFETPIGRQRHFHPNVFSLVNKRPMFL